MSKILNVIGVLVAIGFVSNALNTSSSNPGPVSASSHQVSKNNIPVEKSALEKNKDALNKLKFEYSWTKGGLDNVALLDFKIKNENEFYVKDLNISCTLTANSGSDLGSMDKVLFEKIDSGKSIEVKKFNMGFINSQSSQISCEIDNLKTEAYLKSLNL